jgi:phosphate/sulfate permease
MRLPSELNAALFTAFSWPFSDSPMGLPVSASHSCAVLSADAVTMRLPSGLNAALIILSWLVRGSRVGLPVSASHSRAVLSWDAVTMRLPSGLNAAR